MNARFLSRLPIFACAALIGFLFLANLWNAAVERDWPKLRLRSAQPLNGVPHPQSAPWTLDAFLSGETQRAVSTNLGRASPVFQISVRAKNQFMYSLFKASGAANLDVGRDEQLFATGYIDEFCARGAAPDQERLSTWADHVAEIASVAKAHGKSFLYLVSPSKAAYEPRWLPPGRSCPSLLRGLDTDKLAPFDAALAARGAPFLDGALLMRKERGSYPIDLFPRGGIHWNLLGAALTLREIAQGFAAQPTGSPIGRFDFDWSVLETARGVDRDLLDLLNLYWPPDKYPTATIRRREGAPSCPKSPRLLMVGDSFMRELIIVASQAPCPPTIDHWFYMRDDAGQITLSRFLTQPGEMGNGERVGADLADLPEAFGQADAVVLEENESNLSKTKQVDNLLEAVRASK